MPGVTEYAVFPLKPGLDVQDTSNPAHRIFIDALGTVVSQPGAQRVIYGMELENPTNLRLYVDWDKVEDHIAFTKSNDYVPMFKSIEPLLSGPANIKHVAPSPFPAASLNPNQAPVVEVFSAYFPPDVDQKTQDDYYNNHFLKFVEEGLKTPDFTGQSGGWSLESDLPDGDGNPRKAFVGFIGWTSKEAHMAWRDSETFQKHIHLLRNGPTSLKMFHIKPQEFVQTA